MSYFWCRFTSHTPSHPALLRNARGAGGKLDKTLTDVMRTEFSPALGRWPLPPPGTRLLITCPAPRGWEAAQRIRAAVPGTRETQVPLPAEIKALRWQEAAARLLLPIKQLLAHQFSLLELHTFLHPRPWAGCGRLLPPQLPSFLGSPG